MTNKLGRIGIWSLELRFGDTAKPAQAARELDDLGFGALWVPGGIGGHLLADLDRLLAATQRATIATGILNIWKHDAGDVVRWWKALPTDQQGRVLLGLGVSHAHSVGEAWKKPLTVMRDYLAQLAHAGLPTQAVCLAALGPKMLELAANETAGVHPYLVTPQHTAIARSALGTNRIVAPEQGVVIEDEPDAARERARKALGQYISYPNYVNSWRRLGFADVDIEGMSDRLVDALFAWGTIEEIGRRVDEHFTAGADHVCLQAITGAGLDLEAAMKDWRRLAALL